MPLDVFFGGVDDEPRDRRHRHDRHGGATRARRRSPTRRPGFARSRSRSAARSRALDVARVIAIASAAPGAALTLDANASLTPADAIALIEALRADGVAIALFEQPVAGTDLAGLGEVGRAHRRRPSPPTRASRAPPTRSGSRRPDAPTSSTSSS